MYVPILSLADWSSCSKVDIFLAVRLLPAGMVGGRTMASNLSGNRRQPDSGTRGTKVPLQSATNIASDFVPAIDTRLTFPDRPTYHSGQ
jgi:hypothetical protein